MFYFSKVFHVALFAACSICVYAQDPQQIPAQTVHLSDRAIDVVHVAGLMEVRPDIKGSLLITPDTIVFSNGTVRATIPRSRILNVFVGDQRTEPWGTTGKVVRKVIPYGGGAALGAITNGQVDLLTVESLDEHDGYHGVVFAVPFQKANAIREQLTASLVPLVKHPTPSCSEGASTPKSVLLAPILVSGIELPSEYRILLYEQLFKQLKSHNSSDSFLRTGDLSSGPGCTELTLRVTVTAFKKGNRAVRASTGPLGMFLGTTSLAFDINLRDINEKTIFDVQMKKSDRSDSDSLGLADSIAKSVAKRMDKEMQKHEAKSAV
ncbi:hypothetical protein [Granulicella arctica]|uniref:hypothetical protein n=1 Tax=Granulicella arctica TaxID=940613 RepID=UPI0021E0BD19|nr:hypothetical protein [Granulicella arctica]